MRSGCVVASLALAACLDAPPSSTASDGPPDGGDSSGASLALSGLAARDPLSLDGRDELVLVGQRDGTPVALVLSTAGPLFEDLTVTPADLPFDPVDLTVTPWGTGVGLAVMLGPGGQLVAVDRTGARSDLELREEGDPVDQPFRLVSEIDSGGRRLLLADDEGIYVTGPLGTGEPGELPLEVIWLVDASEPIFLAGGHVPPDTAIGVIKGDREIDVYDFTAVEDPNIGEDLVDQSAPDALGRPLWRLVDASMILLGIDRNIATLWYQRTPLTAVGVETGTIAIPQLDVVHDVVITRLDEATAELILLGETAGQLQVVVYPDPEEGPPDQLPAPLVLPVSGLSPPTWAQAMDAVLEGDAAGENEIIVYDAAGRLACIDLVGGELASCGTFDLAAAL